jgi:hypothetical protein
VPTSVLLAVLAAAGLLALAPALVRRYDATERLAAERASSTARVLKRDRRRRTVPGRHPVNTSRVLVVTLRAPVPVSAPLPGGRRAVRGGPTSARRSAPARQPVVARQPILGARQPVLGARQPLVTRWPTPARRRRPKQRYAPAVYRRRRVLAALVLLNLAELSGVVIAGPGFWSGFSVTAVLMSGYVVHLRNLAIADRRRQRAEAREAAWLAARQAEVRREQARRAAGGGGVTSVSYSYRRAGGVRGRPYQAGPPHQAGPSGSANSA